MSSYGGYLGRWHSRTSSGRPICLRLSGAQRGEKYGLVAVIDLGAVVLTATAQTRRSASSNVAPAAPQRGRMHVVSAIAEASKATLYRREELPCPRAEPP